MEAAQRIVSHQKNAHGAESIVGAIVWADAELGSAKLRRADVREQLLRNGLDPELQPNDPSAQAAFGRALRAAELPKGWKLERSEPHSRKALLFQVSGAGIHRVDRAEVQITAGLTGIAVEPERHLLSTTQLDALAPLDAAYYESLEFLAAHEVQDLLRAALKTLGATRIRPHSGTYFIPERAIDPAHRLARALETLGGTRVVVLPLYDGQSKTISSDLADGFERERRAILVSLHEMMTDKAVRPSTFEARANELAELEARVMVAREVLGQRERELTTRMLKAQAACRMLVVDATSKVDWDALLAEV